DGAEWYSARGVRTPSRERGGVDRVENLRRPALLVVRLGLARAVLLAATLVLSTLLLATLVLLTGLVTPLLAALTLLTGLLVLLLVELDRLARFGFVPTTAHVALIAILTHVHSPPMQLVAARTQEVQRPHHQPTESFLHSAVVEA